MDAATQSPCDVAFPMTTEYAQRYHSDIIHKQMNMCRGFHIGTWTDTEISSHIK